MKKSSRLVAFILLVVLLFAGMGLTYKNVVKNVNLGLDLQGGFEVLFQVDPLHKGEKIDKKALQATSQTLESRVNVLGVSEPKIQIEDPNRIRVQLAGIKDQAQARKMLSTQANLTIRMQKTMFLCLVQILNKVQQNKNLNKKQINQLLHLKLKVKINLKSH